MNVTTKRPAGDQQSGPDLNPFLMFSSCWFDFNAGVQYCHRDRKQAQSSKAPWELPNKRATAS